MRFLGVFALALLLVGQPISATAESSPCYGDGWGGDCRASTDGSSVELGASRDGQSGTDHASSNTKKPGTSRPSPSPSPTQRCATDLNSLCQNLTFAIDIVRPRAEDLASFVPNKASLTIEPDGIGIVGAPTNIVADVRTHTLTGTLFDRPVTVRFTPAAYSFDYGDGTTVKTDSGGSTWAGLHQAQLTSTPTSHVYRARGTYTVSTRIVYDAAVDWGDGVWYDVIGQVRSATSAADIRVYEARTALVEHTCQEVPAAPGC